jgi:hypothetical protein
MALQYISDDAGRHTAVIIPIAEWENITSTHQELKGLENTAEIDRKRKPSDFRGCISKETALEMLTDIEQSRNEWERNF